MIQKGDKVIIKAQVMGISTSYREVKRFPYPQPKEGIVLGYSFIFTGKIINAIQYDVWDRDPSYLSITGSQKVWVIELLEKGNRYLKPIKCLESDITKKTKELTNDYHT